MRRASAVDVGTRQPLVVLGLFILAQLIDGGLTYWGVTTLGTHVELNMLIVTAIGGFGAVAALVAAKTLACACGLILFLTQCHRILAAAAGTYIGVAVVPWLMLFVEHL